LFALGIFGEYLARMHFRSMERPAYALMELTNADAPMLQTAKAEQRLKP
jgi:undecaprenyl-phosphate 4-deoxy-4-formamido-L-arabinose transferase